MVKNQLENALLEMDWRNASIPRKSNLHAQNAINNNQEELKNSYGQNINAYHQRSRSSELDYRILTHSIQTLVGEHFVLTFGRPEIDLSTSTVIFEFERLILLTDLRFVLEGKCYTSRSPAPLSTQRPHKIQIDYNFSTEKFHEAVYCANHTVRVLKELLLDKPGNIGKQNINNSSKLIQFLKNIINSINIEKSKITNNTMNRNQKKSLYESIMKSVSKTVKDTINENIEDIPALHKYYDTDFYKAEPDAHQICIDNPAATRKIYKDKLENADWEKLGVSLRKAGKVGQLLMCMINLLDLDNNKDLVDIIDINMINHAYFNCLNKKW